MDRESIMRVFREPPELETERLLLRKIVRRDTDDMFEYSCDPEVTRYLLWEPHPDRFHTGRYISYLQSRYRSGDFYDWGVIWKQTGKMIGTCGFTRFNFDADSGEVGYVLNPAFWGIRIAPEAVRRVMTFGFYDLGLHRIEAKYMTDNIRSRAVMDKLGMKFEGVGRDSMYVKGEYVSIGTCAILRDEFVRRYGPYIP